MGRLYFSETSKIVTFPIGNPEKSQRMIHFYFVSENKKYENSPTEIQYAITDFNITF